MSACFDENVDFDEFADEDINLSNWSSFHDDHNDASGEKLVILKIFVFFWYYLKLFTWLCCFV